MNCLQNSTLIILNGLYEFGAGYFSNLIDVTHDRLNYIYLENAKNVELFNNFAYGANKFLVSIGADSYIINSGLDGFPDWLDYKEGINTENKLPRYMFYFDGNANTPSNSMIVNTLRINGFYGHSQVNGDNGTNNVGIYNRGSLGSDYNGERENDLRSTTFKTDNWTVKQYNETNIVANTDFSSSSDMLIASDITGVPYYSVNTEINDSNYMTIGSTIIPTIDGRNAGEYTVYYYIPETLGYYEKLGNVKVTMLRGDMDKSGTITILDVRLILQEYINSSARALSGYDKILMDIDNNGVLGIIDVRLLLQEYINM